MTSIWYDHGRSARSHRLECQRADLGHCRRFGGDQLDCVEQRPDPAEGSWVDEEGLPRSGQRRTGRRVDRYHRLQLDGSILGQTYTQNDTITLPTDVGQYLLRIVTDPDQSIQELSYGNNTGVRPNSLSR